MQSFRFFSGSIFFRKEAMMSECFNEKKACFPDRAYVEESKGLFSSSKSDNLSDVGDGGFYVGGDGDGRAP
jgi:hypothetical protein